MPWRLCPVLGGIRKRIYSLGMEKRATDRDQFRCNLVFFKFGVYWPQDWFWGSSSLVFTCWGFSSAEDLKDTLLYVPRGGTGTCPKAALWSPAGSPLVSAPLPSLVSTCLNSGKVSETD